MHLVAHTGQPMKATRPFKLNRCLFPLSAAASNTDVRNRKRKLPHQFVDQVIKRYRPLTSVTSPRSRENFASFGLRQCSIQPINAVAPTHDFKSTDNANSCRNPTPDSNGNLLHNGVFIYCTWLIACWSPTKGVLVYVPLIKNNRNLQQ